MTDPNVIDLCERIKARSEKALAEYGVDTTREDYDPIDWLDELQNELIDAGIYINALRASLVKKGTIMGATPDQKLDEKGGES